MPNPDALTEEAAHNAERYWFSDGFVNFFTGVIFIGMALMFYFGGPPMRSHEKQNRGYWIGYLILLNAAFLHRPIVKWLKQRVTFPRTGYAAPPHRPRPDTGFFAPPMPTQTELAYRLKQENTRNWYVALYVLLWAFGFWPNRWLCALGGVILGFAWRTQQPPAQPSWAMPVASSLVGFLAALLPLQEDRRMAVVIFFFAGVHIFDGIYKLIAYLRQNPLPTT